MVRSMRASYPSGVRSCKTFAAPPVKRQGWAARGQVYDAHVAPVNALAQARAERLGAGLLGGKPLGVGGGPLAPAVGLLAFDLGEHPRDEALAEALQRLLDAADVDEIVADAEDHADLARWPSRAAPWRASSISARMRRTALVEADEDRLADEEVADVELDDLRQARNGSYRIEGEAMACVHFEAGRGGELLLRS